jgi:hypothetical protein
MELGISGLFGLPIVYRSTSADLIAPDGSTLRLFSATNRQAPEYGLRVNVGGPVRSSIFGEVSASLSRATFETTLADDFEGASSVVATVHALRVVVDGGAGWNIWRTNTTAFFVRGTGGWIRDVLDSGVDATDGAVATIGAGVKYWKARANPRQLRYGFRVDGQLAVRWNAVTLDSKTTQLAPVFTAGLIIGS